MLYFLKLGGSLITDKSQVHTLQPEILDRLAQEIRQALDRDPDLQLVIGHGSGSFGHFPAKKYSTRQGVRTPDQWAGFAEVWREARYLNQIVVDALSQAGLPVIAFPPSACCLARNGKIVQFDPRLLRMALSSGLIPLINGDVVFDEKIGGTILSTEDLFFQLALDMKPQRILIAGVEDGVWEDYPDRTRLIPKITRQNIQKYLSILKGSAGVDVTGGMVLKVHSMLALAELIPNLQINIFSGLHPGWVYHSLSGDQRGTLIRA
jgi:isopentenyl phosphate kinase